MDFFPSLGEPGMLDELFWFGPLILQVILCLIFYRLLRRRMKHVGIGIRLAATIGLVVVVDLILFITLGVVFEIAITSI